MLEHGRKLIQKSPDLDESGRVDIPSAQELCLTPSELRERACQRRQQNRKFREIYPENADFPLENCPVPYEIH